MNLKREHQREQLLEAHRAAIESLVAAARRAKGTAAALEHTMPSTAALRAIADTRDASEGAIRAQLSCDALISQRAEHRGVQADLYPEAGRGVSSEPSQRNHATGLRP